MRFIGSWHHKYFGIELKNGMAYYVGATYPDTRLWGLEETWHDGPMCRFGLWYFAFYWHYIDQDNKMDNEYKTIFIGAFVFALGLSVAVTYKVAHDNAREENVGICLRILEYDQHMTREQATQVWSNELKREGR